CFNLNLGKGNKEDAPYFVGNAITMLVLCGSVLCVVVLLFLKPLLVMFGSPMDVLPYAVSYVRITAIGFPFLLLGTGGGHLMRADGSPKMTMISNITGAVINVVLDALFVLGFKWGMEGAALATIISQTISAVLVVRCLMKEESAIRLERQYLGIDKSVFTEPEGKMGIVLTFLMMFIPIFNWIPAIGYLIATVYMMLYASPTFKKCTKFWKFLFGEDSIID
ncbi:MAG: polysaccharide biosynthesis C-terminal domain-containing protein, partial [Spirochaetales bacterium]|nr:polysaccharide biosynthesis C-terminal domain-containing protein [Spirochaetales bacterium]